jgi:hypothetical protein
MTVDQFLTNPIANIRHIKSTRFAANFGVKNDVQQQIAEFFLDFFKVVVEDRFT